MKNFFLFVCCLSLIISFSCKPEKSEKRPNVILIMTDDQGYGDIGAHGNTIIQTPNLDQLHGESIRLTNFHVGTTCAPTRAGLMTGRNCNRVGVWHTVGGRSQLPKEEVTMADVFAASGYRTGMFGKWHLGDNYPFLPQYRGFQETLYHGGGGVGQGTDYWGNTYFDDSYFRNGTPEQQEGYCTDVFFDAALDFITSNKEEPFFCYLVTNAPHGPFHVDSSYIKPYLGNDKIVNPNFYGMITNIDENIGKLRGKLKELGIEENTLLVFMTDNGTSAGANTPNNGLSVKGYNAGMRGKKGSKYEGGHRVPSFWYWPKGELRGGKDVKQLTANLDILPTFIELCGLKPSEGAAFDGTNISPLLYGKSNEALEERVIITDTQRKEHPTKWNRASIMKGMWRLIDGEELYDLHTDPGQQKDISAAHPELVAELREGYETWWTSISTNFDAYTRTIIGEEGVGEVALYSHDWHESKSPDGVDNINASGERNPPWHQRHVRRAMMLKGYWAVDIAQAGTYEIELRRWPKETDAKLRESQPGQAAVHGGTADPEGVPLNIVQAGIQVGGKEANMDVSVDMSAATFTLDLPAGPTKLYGTFTDEDGVTFGAYYAYVRRE